MPVVQTDVNGWLLERLAQPRSGRGRPGQTTSKTTLRRAWLILSKQAISCQRIPHPFPRTFGMERGDFRNLAELKNAPRVAESQGSEGPVGWRFADGRIKPFNATKLRSPSNPERSLPGRVYLFHKLFEEFKLPSFD